MIIVFAFILFLKCQVSTNILTWSATKKLKVEDFRRIDSRDRHSVMGAVTFAAIIPDYSIGDNKLFYDVQTVFDRDSSWMVVFTTGNEQWRLDEMNKEITTSGLAHEQGHFDIVEIYARKIRRCMSTRITRRNVGYIDDSIQHYYAASQKYQELYDQETSYPPNAIKQQLWYKKIAAQLDSLKEYEKVEGEVEL